MFAPFTLAISFAALVQAAPAATPAPARPVQIVAMAVLPGGERRPVGAFLITNPATSSGPIYLYARPTVCEGVASSQKPDGEMYGWEVEVLPGTGASGPSVKWKRLAGAAAMMRPAEGVKPMRRARDTFAAIGLDQIDGDARLAHRRRMTALRAMELSVFELERIPELGDQGNVRLFNMRLLVGELERDMQEQTRLGRADRHPDVLKLQSNLAQARQRYLDEKKRVVGDLIRQYEEGLIPLQPVNGCSAVSYALTAEFAERPTAQLFEAELWFVHRTPDGKETSQRQTVRMREGAKGDFYFDDMTLTIKQLSKDLPIVIEVFGSLNTMPTSDNTVAMIVSLTRRYIPKDMALGTWPKVGKMDYPIEVTPGEVVSFLLPPLEDDHGMFLGHRFSVRLRIKPIGDDELAARQ